MTAATLTTPSSFKSSSTTASRRGYRNRNQNQNPISALTLTLTLQLIVLIGLSVVADCHNHNHSNQASTSILNSKLNSNSNRMRNQRMSLLVQNFKPNSNPNSVKSVALAAFQFGKTAATTTCRSSSSCGAAFGFVASKRSFSSIAVPAGNHLGNNISSNNISINVGVGNEQSRPFQTNKMMMSTSSFQEYENNNALSQTPLGLESASHLLNGLDIYTIYSQDEQKHPITLYGIHSKHTDGNDNDDNDDDKNDDKTQRKPILLLHGRTWSSVPVYHLLGGTGTTTEEGATKTSTSRSLMEALYDQGLQPYALDFRGFGGTPSDQSNVVMPHTCVCDVGYALDFITKKHSVHNDGQHQQNHMPTLLGWSQGALVAQLFAQKSPQLISKLILYGSIYDPLISYPPIPLYVNGTENETQNNNDNNKIKNTFNAAIEDFTIEGSIPPEPATKFAQAALLSDPYKATWSHLSQFNNLDPARISVPTLVVAGDQDPYAPIRVQASLFENLGRGADRTWSIIADADHAVHLLDSGKKRFVNIVTSFVENSKKGEKMF